MSQKEILIYESMEQERKEKVHEIIGDANKFFVKNGYYLFDDGTLIDKNNNIIDQEYMLEKDVRYFLPTGERVERSFTNIEYYNSVDELKSLRKSLQKEYDERLGRSEEKIKKNSEKYLEF